MTAAVLSILPKRKGRQPVADGRQVLNLYPKHGGGRCFVYAIAFDGGVIKVGQTAQPRSRLLTHWKTGAGEVKWVHLFESMHRETAHRIEKRLPQALAPFSKQINGSEWFFATDKAAFIRVIRGAIASVKLEVRARWNERDQERATVEAVKKFIHDNRFALKLEPRP